MSPNSFLIVKNQQCIVFDNVLKIIIVYNFIAIIVTWNNFLTPLPSTTWYFLFIANSAKHLANYYGKVQLPHSLVKIFILTNNFTVKKIVVDHYSIIRLLFIQ